LSDSDININPDGEVKPGPATLKTHDAVLDYKQNLARLLMLCALGFVTLILLTISLYLVSIKIF